MKKLFLSFIITTNFSLFGQDPAILWQRTIGGSGEEFIIDVINTSDGGYLLGGYSDSDISGEKTENSRGGTDFWAVKLDANGVIEWQKTLGGDQDERLTSLLQTADGGFLLGGHSKSGISGDKTEPSRGESDYWIVKLSADGVVQWQKAYGGSGNDNLVGIVPASDGGYVLAGRSQSVISGDKTVPLYTLQDAWVLKIDENGNILWQKSHTSIEIFHLSKIEPTSDGGYILGGTETTSIDFYFIVKINETGNYLWNNYFSGDGFDWFMDIIQTSDNGYLVIGTSDSGVSGHKTEPSNGDFDFWILKLDASGSIEWQKSIGGVDGDQPIKAIESLEGGYFISGYSLSNISGDKTENSNGLLDYWVIKINDVGIIEWQNTIGGIYSDRVPIAIQSENGTYLIVGNSDSIISGDKTEDSRGGNDYWVIKHAQTLTVNEHSLYNQIMLYPNPVKDVLQLDTNNRFIDFIYVYSMSGILLQEYEVKSVSPSIDVSSLSTGMYFVQLHSGKEIALKKFLKE